MNNLISSPAKGKPSLLILMLISLVSLFAVGCGDSREEYVFTGTAPTATVGNLTFQFDQVATAQQAGLVPAGTTSLQFRFYANTTANDTDLVYEATAPYADSVTVENVPTTAVFVRVTAYGANGVPLAVLTGNFQVIAGATVPVDLSTPTAVTFDSIGVSPDTVALTLGTNGNNSAQLTVVGNFSNVQSVTFPASSFAANAEFTSSNPAVATVSTTGLIEAVSNGSAVITTEYTVNGVTRADTTTVTVTGGIVTVDTLEITPSALTLPAGSTSANLTATFTAAGTSNSVDVSDNVTYTSSVAGITVDNETNQVAVAANVTAGTTATVTGSYTTGNVTVTDTVAVTVGNVSVTEIVVLGGDSFTFPYDTVFAPLLALRLSDGTLDAYNANYPGLTFSGQDRDVAFTLVSGATFANVTADGEVSFGNTTGTATVQATAGNATSSFTVTTVDADTYNITVNTAANPVNAEIDDEVPYSIVLNYGNATQDVSYYWALTASGTASIQDYNQLIANYGIADFLDGLFFVPDEEGTAQLFGAPGNTVNGWLTVPAPGGVSANNVTLNVGVQN